MEQKTPLTNLKFRVKNLGSITKDCSFTQKPLTVFCGPSNSGKTWAMYALYSFFCLERNNPFGFHYRNDSSALNRFNKKLHDRLSDDFNVAKEILENAIFSCQMTQKDWTARVNRKFEHGAFIIPAERNGLHLFFRELSTRRAALLHHASKENIDVKELLKDVIRSRYAKPLGDYLNWLNIIMEEKPKNKGNFYKEAMTLQKQLAKGRYTINYADGLIKFQSYAKESDTPSDLNLHITSSTLKSLFGLWYYLSYSAKQGDVLMIDEPELNLHPHSQLVLTHLLVRLVNLGINVVISTHSDYIVREINNLILLNEDKTGNLLKEVNHTNKGKLTYKKNAFLSGSKVGMYLFDNNEITDFTYTPKQGFAVSTFDEAIIRQNETNAILFSGLLED